MGKGELLLVAARNVKSSNHCGNLCGGASKMEARMIIWPNSLGLYKTLRSISPGCLHVRICSSFIWPGGGSRLVARQRMSEYGNCMYLITAGKWTELEIMLGETSQSERDKCECFLSNYIEQCVCIYMSVCRSWNSKEDHE